MNYDEKYKSNDSRNAEKRVAYIVTGILIFLIYLMMKMGPSSSSSYQEPARESYVSKLTYVEGLIERNLKNPDSYKRRDFDVTYKENGDIDTISVEFTATNSFGATVKEKYKFTFDNGRLRTEKLY